MQAPSYRRSKDFIDNGASKTDHVALNNELDKIATSINSLKANIGLIQKDDGSLQNSVVTIDSLADSSFQPSVNALAASRTYIPPDSIAEDRLNASLKFKINNGPTIISEAIAAESTNRQTAINSAIASERLLRSSAISVVAQSITDESSSRRAAITAETTARIQSDEAEIIARNLAIASAITAARVPAIGQTWQSFTSADRAQGVTYTNSTGKTIQVFGTYGCNGGGQGFIYINGNLISRWAAQFNGCGGWSCNMGALIPNGATYMLNGMGGGFNSWWELR